ncbi:Calcium-binding protein [Entamoeba marina]
MAEAFKKIDTDGNGSISYEELKTFVNTKREIKNETLFKMIFNAIDSDGNGQIDVEEFTKFFKATEGQDLNDQKVGNTVLFKLIDVDNDGKLTSEEITAFFKRIHFETYTESD